MAIFNHTSYFKVSFKSKRLCRIISFAEVNKIKLVYGSLSYEKGCG